MTLGESLNRLRTEKGLSHKEVAGLLDPSREKGSTW